MIPKTSELNIERFQFNVIAQFEWPSFHSGLNDDDEWNSESEMWDKHEDWKDSADDEISTESKESSFNDKEE